MHLTITPDTVLFLLAETQRVASIKKGSSISKIHQSNALASYMSRQALMQYYPEIYWRIDMEDFMAKQRNDFNLIEYRLSDTELEAFDAWIERDKVTLVQGLNYCAEKDIKVSFTFSEKNSNWCVSFTGREDNRFNSGTTLTNWSDDAIDAFLMGIYKASIVFADGKWQTKKASQRG